jgi:hypothetical protein
VSTMVTRPINADDSTLVPKHVDGGELYISVELNSTDKAIVRMGEQSRSQYWHQRLETIP